jgi:hypothetical protein
LPRAPPLSPKGWPGDWRTLSGGSTTRLKAQCTGSVILQTPCHSDARSAEESALSPQPPPLSPKGLAGEVQPVSRRSAPGVSYSKPLVIPTREAQRNLLFPATTTAQSERSGPATSASRRKFVLRCFPHAVIYAPKPPPRIVIPKTRRCSAGREILRGSFLLSWLCGGWRTHSGGDKFRDKRNRIAQAPLKILRKNSIPGRKRSCRNDYAAACAAVKERALQARVSGKTRLTRR